MILNQAALDTISKLSSSGRDSYHPNNRDKNTLGFRLACRKVTEPPTDLNSTTALTILENQPIGTIVGEFNATDAEGGPITYHFVDGEK